MDRTSQRPEQSPVKTPVRTLSPDPTISLPDTSGMMQRDVISLQRMIGNRATTSLIKHTARQNRSAIHRDIDVSGVGNFPILEKVVKLFDSVEQPDISPEEFENVRGHQQRFMPLLGRFSTAQGTTLKIGTKRMNVNEFAVTELHGFVDGAEPIVYDREEERFNAAAANREFTRFEVRVLFHPLRVKGEEEPNSLKTVGSVLQAFTHEMTLHAEHMLDYIEQYWQHVNAQSDETSGITPLRSADDEHREYAKGENVRYEFMKARMQQHEDETVKKDFHSREMQEIIPFKRQFKL